jgi:hypothetical protein
MHVGLPHSYFPSDKFDGENLSYEPLDLGVLENKLVGKFSSCIINYDCENPFGRNKTIIV